MKIATFFKDIFSLILWLCIAIQSYSQCNNLDFESGLTGWTGQTGCNADVYPGSYAFDGTPNFACGGTWTNVAIPLTNAANTINTINSTGANYTCTNFSTTSPLGGNRVLQLGGLTQWNGRAERVFQTISITPANAIITIAYAALLQGFNSSSQHNTLAGRPMFSIEVLDNANAAIPCTGYSVYSGADQPVVPSAGINGGSPCWEVYHSNGWQTVTYDLSGYIGQNITIRFTVRDCAAGGDIGMAFVDAKCDPITPTNYQACVGANGTISAPAGSNYSWQPGGQTTQSIPAVNGTYTVTYTNGSGCKQGAIYNVTTFPKPLADMTITSAGCSPNVTFGDNSSTPNGGTITGWEWTFGDGQTSTQQNPGVHVYGSTGTFNAQLIVTTSDGCKDTVVQPLSTGGAIIVDFTPNPGCLNVPTVFTANASGATTYTWNFGEPSSGANNTSNQQNPTHTYSTAGTFNVTLSASDGGGCNGDTTIQVVIAPLPMAAFTNNTVCVGNTTTFTNTSTVATGNVTTWAWNFDDAASGANNISSLEDPTHVFTSAGTYNVMLTVTTDQGCQSNTTIQVTVLPEPVADFTSQNVCVGNNVSFTDASTSATAWEWTFGDGGTSTSQSPQHLYTTPGTYNVQQIVSSGGGCKDTIAHQVTVFPGAVAGFESIEVCVGVATQFTDTSITSGGSTITNWSWNFGDGSPVATTQNPSHTFANAGTYNVQLTVTTDNGCTSSIELPVIVDPLPVADFSSNSVCLGTPTQFTDESTIVSGSITSWTWNFGNGTSTAQNPTTTYTNTNTYTVQLIVESDKGCRDTIENPASVNPIPIVDMAVDDSAGCAPHCVVFADQSAIASGTISSWNWDFGDGDGATQANPKHCYNEGLYSVTLTVVSDKGCSASFTDLDWIIAHPTPVAEFSPTPSETTTYDPNFNFVNLSTGSPTIWHWDFGDGSSDTVQTPPTHTYITENGGEFMVELYVENQFGCFDSVEHPVKIIPDWTFYIPNTFTPNGDGIDDGFIGKGVNILTYEMWIYDRWGNEIYHCNSLSDPWDGKVQGGPSGEIAQIDTYVWLVQLTDIFEKHHRYVGHVNLLK